MSEHRPQPERRQRPPPSGADRTPPRRRGLAQLQRQRDDYFDQLQRSRAEFANYQKRSKAQADADRVYAVGIAGPRPARRRSTTSSAPPRRSGLGPAGISRGPRHGPQAALATLAKHGVEPIAALGKPFDPNQHEPLIQQPDADHPEGTVVAELGKGYRIHDRVLRPTKVAVSVKPAVSPDESSRESEVECPCRPTIISATPATTSSRPSNRSRPTRRPICPQCQGAKLRRKIGAGAAILFKGRASTRPTTAATRTRSAAKADKPSESSAAKPADVRRRRRRTPSPTRRRPRRNGTTCMIRGRCPICAEAFEIESLDDLPSFPFCSDRCRLIDLGRWIDGDYAIPDPDRRADGWSARRRAAIERSEVRRCRAIESG